MPEKKTAAAHSSYRPVIGRLKHCIATVCFIRSLADICLEEMKYDEVKCKGVHVHFRKYFLIRKDASYSSVLDGIKAELFESDNMDVIYECVHIDRISIYVDLHPYFDSLSPLIGYEYYLSDNSGFPITKDGNIVLHKRDGSPESHAWTLSNWLQLCGVRYQSCVNLFCIQKRTGMALVYVHVVQMLSLLCCLTDRNSE